MFITRRRGPGPCRALTCGPKKPPSTRRPLTCAIHSSSIGTRIPRSTSSAAMSPHSASSVQVFRVPEDPHGVPQNTSDPTVAHIRGQHRPARVLRRPGQHQAPSVEPLRG
eukprot:1306769-Pyramimonas_sp.AAC.1